MNQEGDSGPSQFDPDSGSGDIRADTIPLAIEELDVTDDFLNLSNAPDQAHHDASENQLLSLDRIIRDKTPNMEIDDADELPSSMPGSYAAVDQLVPPLFLSQTREVDHIQEWPYSLPTEEDLPELQSSVHRPDPSHAPSPLPSETNAFEMLAQAFALLALILSGIYHLPRKGVELLLRLLSLAVDVVRIQAYREFRAWYISEHPGREPPSLNDMQHHQQSSSIPKSQRAAFKKLQFDSDIVVHPVCPDHDCHEVYHHIGEHSQFDLLPDMCPMCQAPLRRGKQMLALAFARRTVRQEMESLLALPDIEAHILALHPPAAHEDGDSMPTIRLNFSIDWMNPNSFRSGPSFSLGPISMQVLDLPTRLRANLRHTLIVGLTPGPKEPRGINLHKFLIPLSLELRNAWLHGLNIRSPRFPEGRLYRFVLQTICCDRPAAISVTGGPHFSRTTTPCLRCTIPREAMATLLVATNRDSHRHTSAVLQAFHGMTAEISAAAEVHETALDELRRAPDRRSPFPQARIDAIKAKHKEVHGHPSAFDLLPYLDKFSATPFDPMHALLEGGVRGFHRHVLCDDQPGTSDPLPGNGDDSITESEGYFSDSSDSPMSAAQDPPSKVRRIQQIQGLSRRTPGRPSSPRTPKIPKVFKPKDVQDMQALFSQVTLPKPLGAFRHNFGGRSAGSPTANDWRLYAEVFGPLCFPVQWHQSGGANKQGRRRRSAKLPYDRLEEAMRLFEIVDLALRRKLNPEYVSQLKTLINDWVRTVLGRHPRLTKSTNFHVLTHLAEDIERHGSVYEWWCFPAERINYLVKHVNRPGGSSEEMAIGLMKGILRRRGAERAAQHLQESTAVDSGGVMALVNVLAEEVRRNCDADEGPPAFCFVEEEGISNSLPRKIQHRLLNT